MCRGLFFLLLLPSVVLCAEELPMGEGAVVAEPAPVMAVAAEPVILPANTVVELRVVQPVSSRSSKPGETFALVLAEPLVVAGVVLLPADTPVQGEVIHAARSGFAGKAGELIVSARYIDAPFGRIRLRSSFGAAGKSHTDTAIALTVATGLFGMVVQGGEKELPAGSLLSARVAVDTAVPALP